MLRKFLLPVCLLIFGLAATSYAQTVNGFDGQNLSWNNNEGVEQVTNVLQPAVCVENTGSTTNQACNTATPIPLKPGLSITYITATGNSSALQLNFNNFGSFPVKKWQGAAALVSGDLPANSASIITFTGSYWSLYTIGNIPAGGGGGTPCITTANSYQYDNAGAFGCDPDFTFTAPHTRTLGASSILTFTAGATVNGFPCSGLPALTGDATSSGCAVTVKALNGTLLSGLATGILKNTTTTGIPSIAASADITVLWGGSCSSSTFLRGDGQCATPAGTGTVTVVGAGSLTSGAIVTGGSAQTLQTPSGSATLNASGNMSLPGTLAVSGHVTFEGITSTGGTGTGALVFGTAPTITLNNGTGLPISTGVSGLGAGIATFLATPSSANLAAALTDETGTGVSVFNNGPTFIAPALGTPASGILTNETGYLWNNNAAPTGNLLLANGSNSSIFTTTTAVSQFFAFKNTTAAVVGTSQASPIISICGTAFHASASVEDCLTFQDTPGNGNDAGGTFTIGHSGPSTGVQITALAGPLQTGNDGVHAGQIQLPGNTANSSLGSNLFNIYGPSSATFTAYGLQYSTTGPAAAGMEAISAPSSAVSQVTFVTTLPTSLVPAFTGDCTNSAGALALTCTKINGTAFPTSATLVGSNASAQPIAAALPSADIFVGNGSNLPVAVAISGDSTITTAGVMTNTKVNGNTYPANAAFTSGGVACATSTTVLTTSALLTSNVLVKGGGAGVCPTNSLITDTGTTATYTGTGGILAPSFTANGSTAGFIDFPQGSTSSAVAPCTAANSICWQAPAAVTSYLLNLPGTAPTNNNSAMLFSNASPGVGSWAKMPQTAFLASDYTNATTTMSNVTGLTFTPEASTSYHMHCNLIWSTGTATGGPKYTITGPAASTHLVYQMVSAITAITTASAATDTSFGTALNPVGTVVTTGSDEFSTLDMDLINGANTTAIQVQAAAQGAGTLTIKAGSACQLQ